MSVFLKPSFFHKTWERGQRNWKTKMKKETSLVAQRRSALKSRRNEDHSLAKKEINWISKAMRSQKRRKWAFRNCIWTPRARIQKVWVRSGLANYRRRHCLATVGGCFQAVVYFLWSTTHLKPIMMVSLWIWPPKKMKSNRTSARLFLLHCKFLRRFFRAPIIFTIYFNSLYCK